MSRFIVEILDVSSFSSKARKVKTAISWSYSGAISGRGEIGGDDDAFSLDDIAAALGDAKEEPEPKEIKYRETKAAKTAANLKIAAVKIFPHDSLAALKNKIQAAAGVPTYRQHLWYEHCGRTYSPCYEFSIGDSLVETCIWKLREAKSFVNNLPVNNDLYARRNKMAVTPLENALIGGFPAGARWYVADLGDFVAPMRAQFAKTFNSDAYMRDLIYYTFVLPYWPAVVYEVFQMFWN